MFVLIANARLMAGVAAGLLRARIGEERGQDLIEYALIGGLVAAGIAILATALLAGGAFADMGTAIKNCIDFDDLTPCG
jgi:Flp pilus assembly pilin Flp